MTLEEVFDIAKSKRYLVVSTVGEDLASAKAAYFQLWPDGPARENWPDIAYIVLRPKWIRYSNYSGAFVVEEFTL
jgi:hypothetical protein